MIEQPGDWRRLDSRMLAVGPITALGRIAFPLLIVLVVGRFDRWQFAIAVVVSAGVVLFAVTQWLTTRYQVSATQVEVRSGWLNRKVSSIPRDRIRTVDTTSKLVHRVFGLSVVKIGTGESGQTDLVLDAVNAAEARRLHQVLLERTTTASTDTSPTIHHAQSGERLAAFSWTWLRYALLSLSGLAAIGAAYGVALRVMDEAGVDNLGIARYLFDWGRFASGETAILILVVVIGLSAVAVANVIGSMVIYLLQYWGYELTRQPDGTLRVKRGLLTTRAVSVEQRRIRGVEINEALLLRAVGGAKANVITSGRTGDGAELLTPPVPSALAHGISGVVLGETTPPTMTSLRRHPLVALRRILLGDLLFTSAVAVVFLALAGYDVWPWWPLWIPAVLTVVNLVTGWFAYRALGHAVSARYLISRHGFLLRKTVALRGTGIIGWQVHQSFFQRRTGLATLTAFTAAGTGHYEIEDMAAADATAVADQVTPGLLDLFQVVEQTS